MSQNNFKNASYKYCFAPDCKNTTKNNPGKKFICVPRDVNKRKLWLEAAGIPEKKLKPTSYCCEDHFDLKNDMENYLEHSLTGCKKRLKDSVIPRYFGRDLLNLQGNYIELNSSQETYPNVNNEITEFFYTEDSSLEQIPVQEQKIIPGACSILQKVAQNSCINMKKMSPLKQILN